MPGTEAVTWSEELYRIAGRDPAEPAPNFSEHVQLYTPESWTRLQALIGASMQDLGQPGEIDLELIRPDGPRRWVLGRCEPVRDAHDGRPVEFHGTLQDITERKRAEEKLRESEARYKENEAKYRAIVEAFDGSIYVCSKNNRIEYLNHRLMERIGRDATGELCHKALHNLDSVCPWCTNERVFQGEAVRWEVQSPKDGRWYYVVNTPLFHADGSISKQAMIQDITDRKQAEQALRESEERLKVALEGAGDAAWDWNLVTNDVVFSERWSGMMGYAKGEIANGYSGMGQPRSSRGQGADTYRPASLSERTLADVCQRVPSPMQRRYLEMDTLPRHDRQPRRRGYANALGGYFYRHLSHQEG